MLRTFFEKPLDGQDTSHYFKDLEIWKEGEKYTKEQGKRPVIYITLKDIKPQTYKEALSKISMTVFDELDRHGELFENGKLTALQKIKAKELVDNIKNADVLSESLKTLSNLLYRHYGINPLILIDEYDVPIQAGFEHGFYNEITVFMRNFLSAAFKDNTNLYKGVLTGVTRVSKESIFSGLNNLKVNTIFDEEFSDCFGLTKTEVSDMLDFYDVSDKKEEAADWYDRYMFGKTGIYNPWSMIEYLDNNCLAQPYWVNTSSNGLVGQALEMTDHYDSTVLESLVNGGDIETEINANVIYPEIGSDVNVAYSLLAQTGYLKMHTYRLGRWSDDLHS